MIDFACPDCGFKMRAPYAAAGKRGPCKKCGAAVTVPVSPTAVVESTAVMVVSPAPQPPSLVVESSRVVAVSCVGEIRKDRGGAAAIGRSPAYAGRPAAAGTEAVGRQGRLSAGPGRVIL